VTFFEREKSCNFREILSQALLSFFAKFPKVRWKPTRIFLQKSFSLENVLSSFFPVESEWEMIFKKNRLEKIIEILWKEKDSNLKSRIFVSTLEKSRNLTNFLRLKTRENEEYFLSVCSSEIN